MTLVQVRTNKTFICRHCPEPPLYAQGNLTGMAPLDCLRL